MFDSSTTKPVSSFPRYAVGIFLFLASFFESLFFEEEWLSLLIKVTKGSAFEAPLILNLLNFIPNVIGLLGLALIISATGYNIFGKRVNE